VLKPFDVQGICNLFSSAQLLLSRCKKLSKALDYVASKGHWADGSMGMQEAYIRLRRIAK
jgi:hypothetical protein